VTTDADHGRIEVRRHVVSHSADWMLSGRRHPDEASLPGLAMIGMVEATVTRDGRTSTLRRFYLSSARLDAVRFAAVVRAHWRIENSLHWVLDVGFDEDRARNRRDNGPENLTTLRKLALNVLRSARPEISIRRKRKRSGWSDKFARSVLRQMRKPCLRISVRLTDRNSGYYCQAVDNARYDILVLLNDVARLIRTEADKRVRAAVISRAQWIILTRLQRTPGLSQRELAEILEVEPISVGRLVDRLEARGLVERRPDAGDRRIWRLHLLAPAEAVLVELEPQREGIRRLVTEGIDPTALAAMVEVLLQMKANAGARRRGEPLGEMKEAG